MAASAAPFRSDAITYASSTQLLGRRPPGSTENATASQADILARASDEWNLRIDKEVKGCVEGLKGLVDAADVRQILSSLTSQSFEPAPRSL